MQLNTTNLMAASALFAIATGTFAASDQCTTTSRPTLTPVVELYTSEGCSSCPPADRWVSSLKDKGLVVQAFHVGYWDYIGWVDRFAAPAHGQRQREIAVRNNLRGIYTPQVVLDGKDYQWGKQPASSEPARARITLHQIDVDRFEASVTPVASASTMPTAASWSAYWTVTEHGHNSRVKAGENAGEFLQHDFVVRQYTPAGVYKTSGGTPQKLTLRSIAPTPGHARQVNLVVFDPQSGDTLQAVSLQCAV